MHFLPPDLAATQHKTTNNVGWRIQVTEKIGLVRSTSNGRLNNIDWVLTDVYSYKIIAGSRIKRSL